MAFYMDFVADFQRAAQFDTRNVTEAKSGDSIGVKVTDRCRAGDTVYKITDDD